jgi:hypothetical protein
MPTDAEDMDFDWVGRAYIRAYNAMSRFDPETWREIPFDYGEERTVYHTPSAGKPFDAQSAIRLPSVLGGRFHLGGMGVSPQGNIVVNCINPNAKRDISRISREKQEILKAMGKGMAYVAPLYPGRYPGDETHVFDIHGKLVQDDVLPGLHETREVHIDRHGHVYALAAGTPYLDGKKYFNGRGCTLIKVVPGKMKALAGRGSLVPLGKQARPQRSFDLSRPGLWVEGAEWMFGPVGADGHYGSGGHCSCYVNGVFDLDYFRRSFAPEVDRFRVVVLDTNGNVILRIGQYGNVDDGMPLVAPDPGLVLKHGMQPPSPRSIGGDEVAIMHCMNLAVHTDRRLFLADVGNACVRSVKLHYHHEAKVPLKGLTGGPEPEQVRSAAGP